jgi:hypothetical protein
MQTICPSKNQRGVEKLVLVFFYTNFGIGLIIDTRRKRGDRGERRPLAKGGRTT